MTRPFRFLYAWHLRRLRDLAMYEGDLARTQALARRINEVLG